MRLVLLALVLVFGSVAVGQERIGAWTFVVNVDAFTDEDESFIATYAVESPLEALEEPVFMIGCEGDSFRYVLAAGLYVGVNDRTMVMWRVDDLPARNSLSWLTSRGYEAVLTHSYRHPRLLGDLLAGSEARFRIETQLGQYDYLFYLDGFGDALDRLACG